MFLLPWSYRETLRQEVFPKTSGRLRGHLRLKRAWNKSSLPCACVASYLKNVSHSSGRHPEKTLFQPPALSPEACVLDARKFRENPVQRPWMEGVGRKKPKTLGTTTTQRNKSEKKYILFRTLLPGDSFEADHQPKLRSNMFFE